MCNNRRIVWYTYQIDDKGDDGELQHPVGCRHSRLWYRHLGIHKPYAHRLYQYHDNQGQQQLYRHRCREYLIELALVSLS